MVMTPADQAFIGAMSGTVEVMLMQPTIAIKNAVQEGRPISWYPVHMYRGLGMNIVSMAPITASAFGSNFLYNSLHGAITGRDTMKQHERLVTGFMAGATSAAAANPTELVVIRQQQTGMPMMGAIRELIHKQGFRSFGVGIYATMAREGIYAACWMEGPRLVTELLEDSPTIQSLPQGSLHIISGIAAGVAGSTLSHPFDTIKVRMQAFVDREHPSHARYNSLSKATASILREDGAAAFFHGLAPRAFRITCAVFILTYCRTEMSPAYLELKGKLLGE
eukprot:jgi/Ulvmu1/10253/UM060_0054.1